MALAALAPGAVFAGDYRIVRPLASGGMGAVYVVDQLSTGKQRALKVMLPMLVADPQLRRRFEQEARAGAHIASEHVVEVQAAGVDAQTGVPFLVMELLVGDDLAATLRARGALSAGEVKVIFDQLCHGLAAAHAVGVVHRDIKPQNVFLARTQRADVAFTVKILDFGIAKFLAEGNTGATAALGTPLWLAPEQTDRRPVTAATDVWSLGLLAFHALTGLHFWRCMDLPNPGVSELLREVLVDPIPLPSTRAAAHGRSLPHGFDAWFQRCVAREPAHRFQHAGEAGATLSALLSGAPLMLPTPAPYTPVVATPAYGAYPLPAPAQSSMLRPLLIAGAIIGGIFLVGGIETILWLHDGNNAAPRTSDAGTDASRDR